MHQHHHFVLALGVRREQFLPEHVQNVGLKGKIRNGILGDFEEEAATSSGDVCSIFPSPPHKFDSELRYIYTYIYVYMTTILSVGKLNDFYCTAIRHFHVFVGRLLSFINIEIINQAQYTDYNYTVDL